MAIIERITDIFNNDLSRLIIAVVLVGGTFVLLYAGRDVPSAIYTMDGAAVTWFFVMVAGKTAR